MWGSDHFPLATDLRISWRVAAESRPASRRTLAEYEHSPRRRGETESQENDFDYETD